MFLRLGSLDGEIYANTYVLTVYFQMSSFFFVKTVLSPRLPTRRRHFRYTENLVRFVVLKNRLWFLSLKYRCLVLMHKVIDISWGPFSPVLPGEVWGV